jgi:hypothetical protein
MMQAEHCNEQIEPGRATELRVPRRWELGRKLFARNRILVDIDLMKVDRLLDMEPGQCFRGIVTSIGSLGKEQRDIFGISYGELRRRFVG